MARLDAELVRRGLARSRAEASALVAAGRVRLAGTVVTRPAQAADASDRVDVDRPQGAEEYASRAAHKLAGALDALAAAGAPVGVAGASCVDLGASTGGFTDVLLRRGARHVVAIDVGHDQLVERLRTDPRVDVREGVNARDLAPADLPASPDVLVGDLSFISLTLVLPAVARCVGPGADVVLMVKPQFEVGRERLGAGGVVRDPAHQVDAVLGVVRAAQAVGLALTGVVPSPLPGPHGNREFFVRLRPEPDAAVGERPPGAAEAVRAAVACPLEVPADPWSRPPVPPAFLVGAGRTPADEQPDDLQDGLQHAHGEGTR